ncbi:4-hydroxythreonine-4-phosphate dehydrogenase PdxA [Candidatus Albibeggiatoa sp. nov. NOAA]|uniref:4-hydroxythreonine-4-phosphate dehydrogenase PdxA n=1 Tax=Candidatus Albibeggiatoa sp. nov. NOAA TaxID=3162724 RepID=UPI003303FE66|nr:4-hydroxythreonine-4-phosphate dehydrogenase PdxA [Thiotrichaceae bacterium]
MSKQLPRIALTTGEPAGIGVDICLQLAQHPVNTDIVAYADPELLQQRMQQLDLKIELDVQDQHTPSQHKVGRLKVKPIKLAEPCVTGQLNANNAAYVLDMLGQACQDCQSGEFDALVTAPVHKGIINEAGIAFSGHTEFFAEQTQTNKVVMMLATQGLRVALVTTHLPLTQVSAAITKENVETTIRILHHDLQTKFGIDNPRINVCGLNPHAGEGGHLGMEEIEVIEPVLAKLRAEGMSLLGSSSADTAFTASALLNVHAVLAMYHDQGLPVLKQKGFGEAVNVTLGLPIIRTSVDHGTALELAGTGRALSDSLYYAIQTALDMVAHRRESI